MLVLTRGVDEAIVIDHPDGPVKVTVAKPRRGSSDIRLLIDAPRSVPVNRLEVWEKANGPLPGSSDVHKSES